MMRQLLWRVPRSNKGGASLTKDGQKRGVLNMAEKPQKADFCTILRSNSVWLYHS